MMKATDKQSIIIACVFLSVPFLNMLRNLQFMGWGYMVGSAFYVALLFTMAVVLIQYATSNEQMHFSTALLKCASKYWAFAFFLHDADTVVCQICYYELEARGPAFVVNVGPLVVGAKPSLEWSVAHAAACVTKSTIGEIKHAAQRYKDAADDAYGANGETNHRGDHTAACNGSYHQS